MEDRTTRTWFLWLGLAFHATLGPCSILPISWTPAAPAPRHGGSHEAQHLVPKGALGRRRAQQPRQPAAAARPAAAAKGAPAAVPLQERVRACRSGAHTAQDRNRHRRQRVRRAEYLPFARYRAYRCTNPTQGVKVPGHRLYRVIFALTATKGSCRCTEDSAPQISPAKPRPRPQTPQCRE